MSVACIPGTVAIPDGATVPRFTTAVAATDFSEAGNRAITCALGMVGAGTVYAIHVNPEPCSHEQEKALLKKLAAVLPKDAERSGAKVMVMVRTGDPATELVRARDELNADVICLGAKGPNGTKSKLIQTVLAKAARPVLIAPAIEA